MLAGGGQMRRKARWCDVRGAVRWRIRALGVAAGVAASLFGLGAALADGDHAHGAVAGFDPEPVIWGSGALAGIVVLLTLGWFAQRGWRVARPAGDGLSYLSAVRRFSRNARLFLGYSLLAELGSGIWSVMFNLYLLRLEFPIAFVGTFWLVNMLCHAAGALPAGIIADRFGRRRAFAIATSMSLLAQGSLLFTMDPTVILLLGAVAGLGDAFHGVTGPPFMADNSEPGERPYLFSLNASFLQLSRFAGSLAGGALPLAWATTVGVPSLDPAAARLALLTGLPLTMLALTPLALMRERRVEVVDGLRDLVMLRNVVHPALIAQLTLLGLLVGAGFGLTTRFFNVFFQEARQASDAQVGSILALGAVSSGVAVLVAPGLAQRWGKARSILVSQACSVPFLIGMALVPTLSAARAFFVTRNALYGLSQPLRNQLAMDFAASRERGTAAGFSHMAFDLGGGIGAGIAGLLITDGGFLTAFLVASLLVLVPASLYYVFFNATEMRERRGRLEVSASEPQLSRGGATASIVSGETSLPAPVPQAQR